MAHPKSVHPAILSPVTLSKKLEEYEPIAEFLPSCKSSYTAKGCKTALNKFFNFAGVEKKDFDPVIAIKMKPKELNPLVLKYAMHLKKVAKSTEEYRRGEVNVSTIIILLFFTVPDACRQIFACLSGKPRRLQRTVFFSFYDEHFLLFFIRDQT